MKWAGDLVRKPGRVKSHTTQFVVGASDESDLDILKSVDWIYREMHLFRSFFSVYQPSEKPPAGTASADHSLLSEHRLYQCDFLMRGYGFRYHDLVFDERGHVPKAVDPKTAYAMKHPELYPVDINRADEERLLRVPGIGPVSAGRIVSLRRSLPFGAQRI